MFGQVESFKVFDLRIVSCLIELRAVKLSYDYCKVFDCYSSQLNQTTYNFLNKHLAALNLTKHLTILQTNYIQLPTQSNNLQFSDQNLEALNLTKHLTILQTNYIQLPTQSNNLQFSDQTP